MKWIAPCGGGYSAGPAPEGSTPPVPPKNPASPSTSRKRVQKEAGVVTRELTKQERGRILEQARRSSRASMAIEGRVPSGGWVDKPPYAPKHLRVEHYVTDLTALFTPECSCGTVFKQGWTTLADLVNAAIAHGIDVGRQED